MPLPQVLKNFNLFLNGNTYVGKVDEVTPPKLTLKTEEHRGAGMDAPAALDMGLEALEMEFTLSDRATEIAREVGLSQIDASNIILRSAWQDDQGNTGTLVIEAHGRITELDPGSWKPGDKAANKFKMLPVFYKRTDDGRTIHEIDVINGKRIINGIDQNQAVRDALDLA